MFYNMKNTNTLLAASATFILVLFIYASSSYADSATNMPPPEPYCQWKLNGFSIEKPLCDLTGDAERGKKIASDGSKGNCLACHMTGDGTLPGNIGPPLIGMKARFPDKAKLRAQIWDSTVANPNSIMIPFGRNRVLSEEEIDQIVEYIYTL